MTEEAVPLPASPVNQWRWWLMFLLALVGAGISAYLSYAYLWEQAIICGESQGCDLVAQSVYSRMFGIPVAVFGLLTYVALMILLLIRRRVSENLEAYIPLAMFGIAIIGVLFSAYLTYLELFVILAVCKWCVAQAVTMTLFWIVSLLEIRSVTL
jgi:uncharacterized membrane protein